MDKIIVTEGQGLIDLAIELYGNIEAVDWLIEDNAGLTFNSNLLPGMELKIRNTKKEKDIATYFNNKQLAIATQPVGSNGDFDDNDFDSNDFNT
ncbi:MAG: hypothetical protein RQ856_05030 [Candidatus Izemoplasmatales bacterium]|nr:hypothetical protein [Candidatus Izemoplasmatales bacterium]